MDNSIRNLSLPQSPPNTSSNRIMGYLAKKIQHNIRVSTTLFEPVYYAVGPWLTGFWNK